MYKQIIGCLFVTALSFSLFAQQDPDAKIILDHFSEKARNYQSFKIDFTYTNLNKQSKKTVEKKGDVLIKGDSYLLKFDGMEFYSNSKDVYIYLPETKEITITKKKEDDDFFLNDPSKIFYIYNKDYKYKLIGESIYKNKGCVTVDLYPFDIKKNYFRIRLLIEKESLNLVKATASEKAGVDHTIEVNKFTPNFPCTDKDFIFDQAAHKDVEVNDMR